MCKRTSATKANILTVDVEDYFHVSRCRRLVRPENWDVYPLRVRGNVYRVLDLLAESGTLATFFVLGWVAERCPALVREIKRRGHEIASHGYSHQLAYEQTEKEFRQDVRDAKQLLEDVVGCEVIGYRSPSYSTVKAPFQAHDVLAEEGYRYDSSVVDHLAPYIIGCANGRELAEFPLATARMLGLAVPVGRGGYLRLLPLAFLRAAVKRINASGLAAVMSFHPWELDERQPRMPMSLINRFCHYVNLRTTATKLQGLCSSFAFGKMCDHLETLTR